MIDRATGALHFDDGVVIEPTLTRAQFLQMQPGETRDVSVQNEPWCSWRITRLRSGGRVFIAVVQFRGEELQSVELVESDLVGFGDWKDWNEAEELRKKRSYEDLLAKELGSRRSFTWGSARAFYDARSGGSFLSVTYGPSPLDFQPSAYIAVAAAALLLAASLAAFSFHHAALAALLAITAASSLMFAIRRSRA